MQCQQLLETLYLSMKKKKMSYRPLCEEDTIHFLADALTFSRLGMSVIAVELLGVLLSTPESNLENPKFHHFRDLVR